MNHVLNQVKKFTMNSIRKTFDDNIVVENKNN